MATAENNVATNLKFDEDGLGWTASTDPFPHPPVEVALVQTIKVDVDSFVGSVG